MKGPQVVSKDRLASMEAFVAAQTLPLQVVTDIPGDSLAYARIEQGDRSQHAEADLLVAGGRIHCAVALAMAKRLGIPAIGLGALLDELEIKVGSCSLGCF